MLSSPANLTACLTPDARPAHRDKQARQSVPRNLFTYELSGPDVKMETRRDTILAKADAASIATAAAMLRGGGLVAFPTETVYGLGADATSAEAVARIYAAKGRPSFNPLIAHVASFADAQKFGYFSREAARLAQTFWPGPLTLVVPSRGGVCDLARAGLASVGLRVPASPVARALIEATGRPLAAPSGNRSGHISPVTAAHVMADLAGRIDMVLDGGPCPVGVESTIVACLDGPARLLRAGGVAREAIEAVLGNALLESGEGVIAPGQLVSHYAPRARVRLGALRLEAGEAGLDFGGVLAATAPAGAMVLDLSEKGDVQEAAARLFSHLRMIDAAGAAAIAAAPVPMHGLGAAIIDRLARAAAGR